MPDRIKLTADCYMIVDGQPRIVQSGSVIDVPDAAAFAPSTITKLAAEVATTPSAKAKNASVRNLRSR